jgi:hypothetical protein
MRWALHSRSCTQRLGGCCRRLRRCMCIMRVRRLLACIRLPMHACR